MLEAMKSKFIFRTKSTRWALVGYDVLVFLFVCFLMFVLHPSTAVKYSWQIVGQQTALGAFCIFTARFSFLVYRQIWRYGGVSSYIRLFAGDITGGILYIVLNYMLPIGGTEFIRQLSVICLNLLGAIAMRMLYHYMYDYANKHPARSEPFRKVLKIFGGVDIQKEGNSDSVYLGNNKIRIAIVGAGRVGVALADDLLNNPKSAYIPVCFVDTNANKIGRSIFGVPVYSERAATRDLLSKAGVQEIVFALPQLEQEEFQRVYDYYRSTGCKVKVYDYPMLHNTGSGKRTLREFDIEELLFRKPIEFDMAKTASYFTGKTVLVTGGGGSIGSEICRQIAKMKPKKLIILDIYENGAYDIQQELKTKYGAGLDMQVEICSVCDWRGFEQVFIEYRPDILIHAAAHKHVPLMEHNCVEAVKNNIFGTLNAVELCEEYGVSRFMLVSTDKAVNPTNVMGATKRFCELIVLAHSAHSDGLVKTSFTATRFGNVLGSAGSVIPLFRKQIANGGPITLTDRRIIRYFMTIPEATQLVLESGAMAKNGELFALDMGKPVKILDLAEKMIRLSGLEPYKDIQIIETGLRPGEKLYEEILIDTEKMQKTENDLIFIEKDKPIAMEDLEERLNVLYEAVETESSVKVRAALKEVVETFRSPEELNELVAIH